jgi:hypothetical protein
MDTLPTEIMFFASLLLSLGNRLISLGNCGGIAQKDERSYCIQDIMAPPWNRSAPGYAGHPDQVIRVTGNQYTASCVQSDMRFAIAAFCCLLLTGISTAQAAPPAKQSLSTVAGQVVQDPGGMPLKKVVVTLTPVQVEAGDATQRQDSTVTDAEGHFQIDDMPAGNYRVTLDRNGFISTNRRSRSYSSASISVASGQDVTGLLFRMLPAGVIQGKIMDEDGDPLPGVEVTAVAATNQSVVSGGQSNDLGEYRIPGLPSGKYVVMAQSDQQPTLINLKARELRVYAPTFYPGTVDRRQATRIEVHPGDEPSANFNLVLSKTFTVRGSVSGVTTRRPQNTKEPGEATVVLYPLDGPVGRRSQGPFLQGPLLPNATFEVGGVLPGSYSAQVITLGPDG